MSKIKIVVDSCSSITKEMAEKLNVFVIPMNFSVNNRDYLTTDEDLISHEEFYELLEDKHFSKTSCVNPNDFIDAVRPFLEDGYDIAYISLSSGLSASHNNALLAKQILSDEYDNQIEVFDTLTGSVGIYHMIHAVYDRIQEGKDLTTIHNELNKNQLKIVSLFTIGSLDHLRRGGRLSTFSAVVGKVLHISPIITANELGKLESKEKHRGRKKAIKAMLNEALENAIPGSLITIGYTNCLDEAISIEEELVSNGFVVEKAYIDHTMGSHCGPRTIALFYQHK